jgi:hypothetical protein
MYALLESADFQICMTHHTNMILQYVRVVTAQQQGPRRPNQSADMHPTVQNVLAWFAGAVVSIPANMMLLEPMGKLLGAPPAPNVRLRGVILLMHFHSFHCTSSFLLLSSMHPINATQALTSQPAITMSITFSTVDAPLWSMAREGTL